MAGFGQAIGLVERDRLGPSALDGAEAARTSADVAQDHERRRAPRPALRPIRAARTFADRLEPQLVDQAPRERHAPGRRNRPLEPFGQPAPRRTSCCGNSPIAGRRGDASALANDRQTRQARPITREWEQRHAKRPSAGSAGDGYRHGAAPTRRLPPGMRTIASRTLDIDVCRCRRDSIEVYRSGAEPIPGSSRTSKSPRYGPTFERQTVVGDPAVDGHADSRDSRRARKHARQVRPQPPR